jgi:acyl carrier protein
LRSESPSEATICEWCVKYLAQTLDLPDQAINPNDSFTRLGLDSANSVYLLVELEDWLGIELAPDVIFEYPTIAELACYLARRGTGDGSLG